MNILYLAFTLGAVLIAVAVIVVLYSAKVFVDSLPIDKTESAGTEKNPTADDQGVWNEAQLINNDKRGDHMVEETDDKLLDPDYEFDQESYS